MTRDIRTAALEFLALNVFGLACVCAAVAAGYL